MAVAGFEYVYLVAFVAIMLLLRMRRQSRGNKASAARIFRYPAIYVLLSLLIVLDTPSAMLLLAVLASMACGYVIGTRFGHKSEVFASSDNKVLYRYSNETFAIWIAAFVVRLLIEFMLPAASTVHYIYGLYGVFSGNYLWASIADMLLAFSAGLLLGEAIHLYGKYKNLKEKIGHA